MQIATWETLSNDISNWELDSVTSVASHSPVEIGGLTWKLMDICHRLLGSTFLAIAQGIEFGQVVTHEFYCDQTSTNEGTFLVDRVVRINSTEIDLPPDADTMDVK